MFIEVIIDRHTSTINDVRHYTTFCIIPHRPVAADYNFCEKQYEKALMKILTAGGYIRISAPSREVVDYIEARISMI